jgi:transposase
VPTCKLSIHPSRFPRTSAELKPCVSGQRSHVDAARLRKEHRIHQGIGGHVHTSEGPVVAGRCRRRHSEEFKAKAVQACTRPGVSMAAVALSCGINANLLRRWVVQSQSSPCAVSSAGPSKQPTFIPLSLPAPAIQTATDIRIEIKRGATSVIVNWPASAAEGCAAWLRELLR